MFEGETIEAKKNMDLCVLGGFGCGWNDFVLFRFLCLFFLFFVGRHFEGMRYAKDCTFLRDFEGRAVED